MLRHADPETDKIHEIAGYHGFFHTVLVCIQYCPVFGSNFGANQQARLSIQKMFLSQLRNYFFQIFVIFVMV